WGRSAMLSTKHAPATVEARTPCQGGSDVGDVSDGGDVTRVVHRPVQCASAPWHICIVTETYPPDVNGVAMTLAQLVRGLRARDHRVSVVRPGSQVLGRIGDCGDPTVTLTRSVPVPGYASVRLGWPSGAILQRCWTAHRPDVVYVATEGPLGWSAV